MTGIKFILIGRSALEKQLDAVKDALKHFELAGVLVSCPKDAELGHLIHDSVAGFDQPVAIIADFAGPLALIGDDGTLQPLELPEPAPEPQIVLVEQ